MAKTPPNPSKTSKRGATKVQHGDFTMPPPAGRRGPGMAGPPGMLGGGPEPMMGPNGMGVGEMFMPAVDPTEKIAAWFETTLTKGPIERVRLVQKVSGGEQPVAEFDREELTDMDPDSVAQAIYLRALEDVDGSGGLSRFVALAYRPGAAAPATRTWFRLAAEDLDSVAETEDPATPAGMLSQSWRHNEALMKLSLSTALEGQRLLSRELARITEQNERFEQRHVEWITAREELADRSAVRQLQVKAGEAQLARSENHKSLRDSTLLWAMGLAASRFGVPLPPGLAAVLTRPAPTTTDASPAGAEAPPGAAPTVRPRVVQLTADQVGKLGKVTLAVLHQLVDLPRAVVDALLTHLEPDQRALVSRVIADAIARRASGDTAPPSTEAEQLHIEFQAVVAGLLGGGLVDDATATAVIAQLHPEVRPDAEALRAAIVAQRTATPAQGAA